MSLRLSHPGEGLCKIPRQCQASGLFFTCHAPLRCKGCAMRDEVFAGKRKNTHNVLWGLGLGCQDRWGARQAIDPKP